MLQHPNLCKSVPPIFVNLFRHASSFLYSGFRSIKCVSVCLRTSGSPAHACSPLCLGVRRARVALQRTNLEEAEDVGDHDALGGDGGPDDAGHGLDGQLGHRRLLVAALEMVCHVQAADVPAHEVNRLLHRVRVHRTRVPDVHAQSQACAWCGGVW